MPYKDKNKAKQVARERMRRTRAQQKGEQSGRTSARENAGEHQGATPNDLSAFDNQPGDDELFAGLPRQVRVFKDSPDWKKDLKYRQLIHKLKTSTIDQLKAQGVWIPCWRLALEG